MIGMTWLGETLVHLINERDRYREALERIAADAAEAPMEDMLSAGKVAREALAASPPLGETRNTTDDPQ
jgi:hypothetical protein